MLFYLHVAWLIAEVSLLLLVRFFSYYCLLGSKDSFFVVEKKYFKKSGFPFSNLPEFPCLIYKQA